MPRIKARVKRSTKAARHLVIAITAPLLLGLPAHASSSSNKLPDIGTAGLSALTLEKEREVGKQAMMHIRATYPLLHDPALLEYTESLGYRLINSGSTPIHPFTFFLVNDLSINAFAFFGGHVGIHTGLFAAAEDESELASVVAHEIAHVNQRHLARHIEKQAQMQPATLGATLGAILLTVLAPQAGIAALQTSMALSQQMSINFTRQHEAEADRIGMQNLVAAGFDPYAMPSFFGKLSAKYRYISKPPAFLLTHPLSEARIADSQLRANQFPHHPFPVSTNFQFAKARVKARYTQQTPQVVVQQLEFDFKNPETKHRDAVRYGLALAQLGAKQAKKAYHTIKPLMEKYPRNLFVLDAITDIELALNKKESARRRLEGFYQYMPDNQVIALNYANILLHQKQYEKSIDVLQAYLLEDSADLSALGLLEEAYSKAGLIGQQYSARADSLALMGRYEQAIAMLERALRSIPMKQRIEIAKLEAKKRNFHESLVKQKSQR